MSDTNSNNNNEHNNEDSTPKNPRFIPKTAADLQRLELEKLMKNPEKLVNIPIVKYDDKKKLFEDTQDPKYISGSSAGAGSGDFHVYRAARRREFARQDYIDKEKETEVKQMEYELKIKEKMEEIEKKTNKNRAKRLRRKANTTRK